jgi:hypothetical protein
MFAELADEVFSAVETVHHRQILWVLFHQRDPFLRRISGDDSTSRGPETDPR